MASVALVEPQAPDFHAWSFAGLPRLGLPLLGTILRNLGHEVTIYCQGLTRLPWRELLSADVVGISTTTSTAPEAYRIAAACRASGTPVVIGGVHATFNPQEALQHADCCLLGEAEEAIGDVVDHLLAGAPPSGIPGACFRVAAQPGPEHHLIPRVSDLESLPFPDLSLIHGWRGSALTPILTSRGCPHDCDFCSVTAMFGRRYRFRSAGSVLDELAAKKPRTVFFYDDNFAARRRRSRELLEGMLRLPHPPKWMAQVRADVTKDRDLIALMEASRCARVFIGYESISPGTLESYNKGIDVEQIVESVRIFHEHGIAVHGMFVLGGDEDSQATIRETAAFALRHALDTVQFLILTPLPGTRMFRLLEGAKRIFVRDWSLYDGHHVVYEPLKMTAATLQREAWRAQKRFYSIWQCARSFTKFKLREGMMKTYSRTTMSLWKRRNTSFLQLLGSRDHRAGAGVPPT